MWAEESAEIRAEYEEKAQTHRDEKKELETPLRQASKDKLPGHAPVGPLGIESLDGPFPVEPALLEEHQDKHKFAQVVKSFVAKRGFYTPPLEPNRFPPTLEPDRVCTSGDCCKDVFEDTGRMTTAAACLLNYIIGAGSCPK